MTRIVLFLVLLLSSCQSETPAYVQADRLTFDAISPKYLAYVQTDPALDAGQKKARQDLVRSWRARLEAAEAKHAAAGGVR